eukprot:scaffold10022_cov170-Amphora_coffeaeformis.AAC.12
MERRQAIVYSSGQTDTRSKECIPVFFFWNVAEKIKQRPPGQYYNNNIRQHTIFFAVPQINWCEEVVAAQSTFPLPT